MFRMFTRSCAALAIFATTTGVSVLLANARPVVAQVKLSDDALRDRLEHRLQTDPLLKRYDVRVKVDNGDVKLQGTVATKEQKSEAERVAKLAGVDDIDNNISVDKDADQVLSNHAAKGLRRTGEAISDAWITSKVRWFFIGEPLLDGSKIDVETKNHVVTLDGKVTSDEGRARANELANDADGVTKVVDKLKIDRD